MFIPKLITIICPLIEVKPDICWTEYLERENSVDSEEIPFNI